MDKGKIDKSKATAVAAVAAAGVLVGGAFSSPAELMDADGVYSPTPIVQSDDDGGGYASDGDENAQEDKLKKGVTGSVRRLLSAAPPLVKACVGVPLWGIGWVIISLASALWTAVLSPAAAAVLGWLGIALLAVLVFALAVKTVFPDMPLKKILNKRSISTIVILVLGFAAVDTVLPLFWADYGRISRGIKLAASLMAAGVPTAFLVRRELRRRRAISAAKPETDTERETRRLVEELADSVC